MKFKKFLNYSSKLLEFITQVLLALMVIIISYQVFGRFVLKKTPFWSEEVSLFLMIWFGLLGASIGVKDKTHLSVRFLVDSLPKRMKKIFEILSFIFIAFFSLFMIISGIKLVNMTRTQTLPATGISVSLSYLALPLSGFFILLYLIVNYLNSKENS